MKILALDTATEACSAALLIDGQLTDRYVVEPRRHNELILPMIDELLSAAGIPLKELDYLAFGRGPGAFTGLRIAAGVVQGLALSHDIPVFAVSDLAASALRAGKKHGWEKMLVLIDARMQEVYQGGYRVSSEQDRVELQGRESVIPPAQVELPDEEGWYGVGSGFLVYPVELADTRKKLAGEDTDCLPRAREIALLAVTMAAHQEPLKPEQALPVYLRDKVTDK
ncbi:MAG: tRNA (adenosine(37)-N6)-threonylcarbamoyltransferase complex dimerization subunit type 1 TsaB [Gammaproteobacteria bacterium]|nr:tRNA (adenosine(37)-N6)-threonylcarbamoyltransferase complex dimerization subunit type 1 TsaB [Gammaproteobacteria bacterium]